MAFPRVTTRRLMILIALAAILAGAWVHLSRRSSAFETLARKHNFGAVSSSSTKKIAYHLQLIRKYQYAASHPWLPVPADPPMPQ